MCRVILSMWCILGGRRVCCIVGVYMVDIREQRMREFFYSVRRGLYRFYVDGI